MVTLSIVLYILGMIFCVIFAARSLEELKNAAEDITFIKEEMENFMATAEELKNIAISLLEVANQVKVIVEDLRVNSVSQAELDPVAESLNQSVAVLNSIVTPPTT